MTNAVLGASVSYIFPIVKAYTAEQIAMQAWLWNASKGLT
jgi:hypothetical protein